MRWKALLLALLAAPVAAAERPAPLALERTIVLPDVAGRIDHLAIDLRRQRLFVAELGNGTVEAIDLASGKPVKRLTGFKEPQGLAWLEKTDQLVVASGGDGKVRFYAGEDLRPAGEIALGDDADNVRADEGAGQVLVGFGSGALAVIDSARRQVVKTIALGAHPEGFRLDPRTRRVFVNLPNARRIAAVDLDSGTVTRWPQGLDLANFPMALDPDGKSMAVVFRAPAQLQMIDTASGKARQKLATCGDSDDVFLDPARRNIYVSCGQGMVDVFHSSGGPYALQARIQTRAGARTALFAPEIDRLFVAARAGGGQPAAILVYKPAG
ncbi:MAG: YncE family protein [Caulobacteraceae bacterium]